MHLLTIVIGAVGLIYLCGIQWALHGRFSATGIANMLRGRNARGEPAQEASNNPVPAGMMDRSRQIWPQIDRQVLAPLTSTVGVTGRSIIKTKRPITNIHLIVTVTKTDGTAVGDVEDTVKRLMHQVRLTHGGTPIGTYGNGSGGFSGGQALDVINRGWIKTVPTFTGTVVGGTNTGTFFVTMPISLPSEVYGREWLNRTALRIGNDNTWRVEIDGGTVNDIFTTPGTGSITVLNVEIFCEVDDSLSAAYPAGPMMLFANPELQVFTAASATQFPQDLNANGNVLAMAFMQRNNGLRANNIVTDLQLVLDTSEILFDGTWNALQWLIVYLGDGAANAAVGHGFIDLDPSHKAQGVPAAAAAGWQIKQTRIAGAAVAADDGLHEQTMYLLPLGAAASKG